MANVFAATKYLANLPFHGNTPADLGARDAVEMLKTAVAQQEQYSHGFSYLHGTTHPSMRQQAEYLAPAASSSHHQQKGQQAEGSEMKEMFIKYFQGTC